MKNTFRSGIADSSAEFQLIASHAADMPLTYGAGHRDWAYGKLLNRMEDGLAVPCVSFAEDTVAAVTVAYPEPPGTDDPGGLYGVEIKLWRTVPSHRGWGLGRLTMKGAFNGACHMMGLAAGTPVRIHLDTRDPRSATAFAAMGFVETDQGLLYPAEDAQDLPPNPDRIFEKIVMVPDSLHTA